MIQSELVYIGKIIQLDPIPKADFIVSATVDCGVAGTWMGVVNKDKFNIGSLCCVYLPDALIPENESMTFMKHTNWRVIMRVFMGVPSEVVIMPIDGRINESMGVGEDITELMGVTKYIKYVRIKTDSKHQERFPFPSFIPRTDEQNYQRAQKDIDLLTGQPWYVTEKLDGSSTTAYKWRGKYGICSRNLELNKDEASVYSYVSKKYNLEEKLPEGLAIQWETCGPGIQSNPMGLFEVSGFMFNAFHISTQTYLTFEEMKKLSEEIQFPMVKVLDFGDTFSPVDLRSRAQGFYQNGKPREGVVFRSQLNFGRKPISFKAINLFYGK